MVGQAHSAPKKANNFADRTNYPGAANPNSAHTSAVNLTSPINQINAQQLVNPNKVSPVPSLSHSLHCVQKTPSILYEQLMNNTATTDPHTNLLSGRKAHLNQADSAAAANKENPLKRKSSDKRFKQAPSGLRNSSAALKSNSVPAKAQGQAAPPSKNVSALAQIGNAFRDISPTNTASILNPAQLLGRKQTTVVEKQVVIHVCDESKKKNQDFKCERALLLQHMKYFDKYLADQKSLDDIDISVHCDIQIFEWLMSYVKGKEPELEIKSAISILISSDFLQMAPLVAKTTSFIAQNL